MSGMSTTSSSSTLPGKQDNSLQRTGRRQKRRHSVRGNCKRQESIEGLDDLVDGLEQSIDVDVGVLAALPIGYKDTRDQRGILRDLRESGFPVPVVIGERGSLMEGSWMQQCSPYTYVEKHRNRQRDYELETLEQFDELARSLEKEAGLEIPEVTA